VPLEAELSLLDNNDTQSENAESLSGLSVLTRKKVNLNTLIHIISILYLYGVDLYIIVSWWNTHRDKNVMNKKRDK